jgi:vitamin B12/bleomycin/antimicrobial peptide transport system ATP-binding/permease protein
VKSRRRQVLVRAIRSVRLFLSSDARPRAIIWIVALLGLVVAVNVLNVVNSFVGRDFMTSVVEKKSSYARNAIFYAIVFIMSGGVAAMSRFSEERLRLLWREWTTRRLIGRYLEHQAYYRIAEAAEVDNPDQRITDDVKAFTQTALGFLLLSLNAMISSVSFLGVLWSITPWLVAVAIGYAVLGTGLTILLGRPLIKLNNLQLKKEADLRFGIIQVRESAEPIAVAGAEGAVEDRLRIRLSAVVRNNRHIIAITRNMIMFTGSYNNLIQLIPILIVAPLYFHGKIEFGQVTQSVMAFAQVLAALSLIITQFESLSSFAAVGDRVDAVVDAVDRAQRRGRGAIRIEDSEDRVAFQGVTLRSPWDADAAPYVRDLNLDLPPKARLLVNGPNPAGKRSLFLALAGIWEAGDGRITRPGRDHSRFVPRRPLFIHGNLRDQIRIECADRLCDDAQILEALRAVGFEPALERLGGLDAEHDWAAALSQAEQQLLAFARLLIAKPRYAYLDHTTDSIPSDQASLLLKQLNAASIAYVSFAENRDLLDEHDTTLELEDDGSWHATPAHDKVAEDSAGAARS